MKQNKNKDAFHCQPDCSLLFITCEGETPLKNHQLLYINLSSKNHLKEIKPLLKRKKVCLLLSDITYDSFWILNPKNLMSTPSETINKLLKILYKSYLFYKKDPVGKIILILPQLNYEGKENLKSLLIEIAHLNHMDYLFLDWIENL